MIVALEAHKSHTVVFSACGLEVGYENPVFACLELDYETADQPGFVPDEEVSYKMLTFYRSKSSQNCLCSCVLCRNQAETCGTHL